MIRPIGDRVLIQPVLVKGQPDHGIITPDAWLPRPAVGLIVALGRDAVSETGLHRGDRVLLIQNAGTEVKDGNWIYRASEIIGTA